jgi:hypothetical protein
MPNEKEKRPPEAGEMKKHRVTTEDGRRYLIFYTFEKTVNISEEDARESEKDKNV